MNDFKVMLIDDDEVFNFISVHMMKTYNFASHVDVYLSPNEAVKKLTELPPDEFPDCIFLDLDMPSMDGWDFLDAFKNLHLIHSQRCAVFILTSSVSDSDTARILKYPEICELISKPLSAEKLNEIKLQYF